MLASAELGEDDADKRPTVQVGDPFEEKKLIECSLELLERGLLVSLQDLGAAGPDLVASEMASKGEARARHRRRHACRCARPDMEPFEIMVSESQERMLCVVEPARVDEVLAVCAKWEVHGDRDRRGDRLRPACGCCAAASVVGDMPVDGARGRLPAVRPRAGEAERADLPGAARATLDADDPRDDLLALLRSANIASRRPVFEQYDCLVQSRTVRRPDEADAAVLLLDRSRRPPRSPSRSTAPAAASRATRTAGRSRRCSSARPTSRASAPSRSA